ncbi:hypothetical protein HYC85_027292 [Camellia sinensis]|uniref:Sulfite exporter TauE/SafE family protein n=1 Tax=Camellia sinensis TaxID=4442 RepID=A0A7J7G615_CAMSI|nr:hypothetical protein HYC85_027292 [Camellia sinensis]
MSFFGMIIGAAISSVYYNLKLRHPTLDMPEAAKLLEANGNGHEGAEYKLLPDGPSNGTKKESNGTTERENYTATCSTAYWVLNLLQIPVSVAVTLYEAIGLYKGKRQISSRGNTGTNLKAHQLILYCSCGVLAGIVGGLLGLGGGFILGPLFLELGVPPQVSSATATFAMTFSSSMSVVEYYLLKRFPVPYALYFVAAATVAAFIGQHVVQKLIIIQGKGILNHLHSGYHDLRGVGISNMIGKIEQHEYMGFEDLCKYDA